METVEVINRLRAALECKLSEQLNESTLFIDLADIYEISQWYVTAIHSLIESPKTNEQIEVELIEIETQIFFHLKHHLSSLVKILPRAIKQIGSN